MNKILFVYEKRHAGWVVTHLHKQNNVRQIFITCSFEYKKNQYVSREKVTKRDKYLFSQGYGKWMHKILQLFPLNLALNLYFTHHKYDSSNTIFCFTFLGCTKPIHMKLTKLPKLTDLSESWLPGFICRIRDWTQNIAWRSL